MDPSQHQLTSCTSTYVCTQASTAGEGAVTGGGGEGGVPTSARRWLLAVARRPAAAALLAWADSRRKRNTSRWSVCTMASCGRLSMEKKGLVDEVSAATTAGVCVSQSALSLRSQSKQSSRTGSVWQSVDIKFTCDNNSFRNLLGSYYVRYEKIILKMIKCRNVKANYHCCTLPQNKQ